MLREDTNIKLVVKLLRSRFHSLPPGPWGFIFVPLPLSGPTTKKNCVCLCIVKLNDKLFIYSFLVEKAKNMQDTRNHDDATDTRHPDDTTETFLPEDSRNDDGANLNDETNHQEDNFDDDSNLRGDNETNNESVSESKTENRKSALVASHIKEFEEKLETGHDSFVPSPAEPKLPPPQQNGVNNNKIPPPKPALTTPKAKLYDSIYADRKMTKKELKRRQFLFGVPAPAEKVQPKQEEEIPLTKIETPEPEKCETDNGAPAVEIITPEKKNKKGCCCTVM